MWEVICNIRTLVAEKMIVGLVLTRLNGIRTIYDCPKIILQMALMVNKYPTLIII